VTGQVYMGGGFSDAIRERMSPQLQQRIAWEEQQEQQENARIERQREVDRERWHERSLRGAAEQAIAEGRLVTVHERMTGEGLGHTPSERIALANAAMDLEDQQEESRRRAALRRFEREWSDDRSHDSSAPTAAEAEMGARIEHHALAFETRQIERDRKAAERKAADARILALARSVVRYG
jgi:hypothetical protein